MAEQFPVKWMSSEMPGAPELRPLAGRFLTILDSLLVTGFGAITALRVTVENGIATCVCNDGETFIEHTVIEITGADDAALNGQARVLSSAAQKFTWATEATDGVKLGSIVIKVAPAGWERLFAGENKAVYRSRAADASGVCYRIDDAYGSYVPIKGYASMSDIDTGEYQFGAVDINRNKNEVNRAFQYTFFADDKAVILAAMRNNDYTTDPNVIGRAAYFFGQLVPLNAGAGAMAHDAICGITAWEKSFNGVINQSKGAFFATDASGTLTGSSVPAYFQTPDPGEVSAPAQGSLFFARSFAHDSSVYRGMVPGFFGGTQRSIASVVANHDTVEAVIDGKSRTLVLFLSPSGDQHPGSYKRACAVDITGPWR